MARTDEILALLDESGAMSVSALAEHFEVNVSTLRRDVDKLSKAGRVIRTHGTVSAFTKQKQILPENTQRNAIGRAMADRILEKQVVLLDGGLTCLEVAREIDNQHLTVVTNDFRIADEIARKPQINLVFIGGELLPNGTSTWGPTSIQQVENMRFNVGVFGATTIREDGIYAHSSYSIELRRKMLHASNEAFFVAESTKFGRDALFKVFDFDKFTAGITDSGLDPLTAAQWPVPIIRAN